MDIITLRVINEVHGLGLTEAQLQDIETETQAKERSGQYVAARTKDSAVIVDHDEKHVIELKDIVCPAPSRILFKTLITFKDVPDYFYTLHKIGKYRGEVQIKYRASNIEELKDRIIKRFSDGVPHELGGEYDEVWGSDKPKAKRLRPEAVETQLRAIYTLFGEEWTDADIPSRLNVARIIKVWSLKNRRVALFQEKECYTVDKGGGCFHNYQDVDRITYKIKAYCPKDKEYNYVCPNREVGLTTNSDFMETWLDDNLFEKVSGDELEIIMQHKVCWLLDADKYFEIQHSVKNEQRQRIRAQQAEETNELLTKNIKEQFKNGSVVRKGILFTKRSIEYEGLKLTGDDIDGYIVRNNIVFLEEPKFEDMFYDYIKEVFKIHTDTNYYPPAITMKFHGIVQFKIGNVTVQATEEKGRLKINGLRVAREDFEEVAKSALQYETQSEYDKYVQSVSKVCLKMQRILAKGFFEFEVDLAPLKNKKMVMVLPVTNDGIMVSGRAYKIKNVRSFCNLDVTNSSAMWRYEGSPLQKFCNHLYKAVKGLEVQNIAKLVREGIDNYNKKVAEQKKLDQVKVEASREFLANAVRLTNAQKVKDGYLVKGISGNEYTVNEKTAAVYHKDEYVCIVDMKSDKETEWGKNDIVAKRLLMLAKDMKVAREVHTLGDRMDKTWQELSEVET